MRVTSLAVALMLAAACAQDEAEITATPVAGTIYMLQGQGGNIGLCTGPDGAFVIDDQFAPLSAKILAKIEELGNADVRFVLNTHWHGDHTGGNENFANAGAVIVAHENVRQRMSSEQFITAFQREVPPSPKKALPVVTFLDGISFHVNDETIEVFHVPGAHTDGDAIVHFLNSDVLHMGDTYFAGTFPFIDTSSGGSIDGVIAAIDTVLARVGDETAIIPGHGPLSNKAELGAYRDMLRGAWEAVAALVDAGHDKEAVIGAKPLSAFEEEWGQGWMKADTFTGILYDSLTAE